MYIYIYVCISIRIYAYIYGCVYMCMCMYICIYDRKLCQDVCFLSGGKKQEFTIQKSKFSGRYDEFAE